MLGSRFDLDEVVKLASAGKLAGLRSGDRDGQRGFAPDIGSAKVKSECLEIEREVAIAAVSVQSTNSRVNFKCPVCDDAMTVRDESAMAEFGSLDVKFHQLECLSCGMLTGRVFHPAVGYREVIR